MTYGWAQRVEWDSQKNAENLRKHGVSFEEAAEVFQDDKGLEIFDELHSDMEERFITIGPVRRGIVLVVWTERDDDVVRIISARWASQREIRSYREYAGEP